MSVNKYYEVECNKCGKIITRFNHYKPSVSVLNKYCTVVRRNGKQLTYCNECYSDNIQNKRRVREIGLERIKKIKEKILENYVVLVFMINNK